MISLLEQFLSIQSSPVKAHVSSTLVAVPDRAAVCEYAGLLDELRHLAHEACLLLLLVLVHSVVIVVRAPPAATWVERVWLRAALDPAAPLCEDP